MPKPSKKPYNSSAAETERQPASELQTHKVEILNTWKLRLKQRLPSARAQTEPVLLDSLPVFIDRLVDALATSRDEKEKIYQATLTAAEHGELRAELPQYTMDQVLIEYRILREVILDVLDAGGMLTKIAVNTIEDSIESGMSTAATAFLRIRTIREMQARREAELANLRLKGLQEVTEGALAKTTSLQELLSELLARVRQVFRSDTVVILLADEKEKALTVCAAQGLEGDVKLGMKIPFNQGIAGRVYTKRRGMIFNDLSQAEIYSPILKLKLLHSLIAAPLKTSHEILGVIHVGSINTRKFSQDELKLLQMIGDRIAVAIENAKLYEDKKGHITSLLAEKNVRKRFISILTHDIRNPLSAAQMSASLLRRYPKDPELIRTLSQRIVSALSRSDQLIQDLLDINKILGKEPLHLELESLDFMEIVSEVIAQLCLTHGDRFVIHKAQPTQGIWSRREITRLVELSLGIGIQYGLEQTPIIVSLFKTDNQARFSIRFHGNLKEPPNPTKIVYDDNFPAILQKESRLSLDWALVKAFAESHGGAAYLRSSKYAGSEIEVVLALTPSHA
jgi:K+-sensing histidine kinase KdpD